MRAHLFILLLLALAGCGQKGPLYFADEGERTQAGDTVPEQQTDKEETPETSAQGTAD